MSPLRLVIHSDAERTISIKESMEVRSLYPIISSFSFTTGMFIKVIIAGDWHA